MKSESIIAAVNSVTRDWCKQRKAEERNSRARNRRSYYSDRVNFSDIAEEILPDAYAHASGGGAYTVSKRQLYYASREKFKEFTGREIEYGYFAQQLLVQYMNRHDVDWKITADPRGTFTIPNASHEVRIPVGTIPMDRYLEFERDEVEPLDIGRLPISWPSQAEGQRYAAVLYIEKEGFEPLLKEARIAERYDLAILSCKGQSVVAARKLVDTVCCAEGGVPLFTVHDFDKYGFEIAECLTTESDWAVVQDRVAYTFQNQIRVIDFGLRLEDVEKYELVSERCQLKGRRFPASVTQKERDYLASGRRVELNSFTAPQFVEWLETKLKQHLPDKLIPCDEVLEQAYRRSLVVSRINSAISEILQEERGYSERQVPEGLRAKIQALMARLQAPWDEALYALAEDERDDEELDR